MLLFIVQDIARLITRKRRFDIHNSSLHVRILGISYGPHHTVRAAQFCPFDVLEWPQIEGNFYAEVNPALANRHPDSGKLQISVVFAVTDHDIRTAAADKFVKTHVVEMA